MQHPFLKLPFLKVAKVSYCLQFLLFFYTDLKNQMRERFRIKYGLSSRTPHSSKACTQTYDCKLKIIVEIELYFHFYQNSGAP